MLNEKKGEILSYDEIFIGLDIYNSMNKTSLKSLVLRLKKKLGANIIKNISMSGYKLTKA
ncbi:transcriptional regulator [Campylobacter hyointestinalis subsp. hyointestinalis]|nr:transcriptional regulator [Campylobacter hyointestinalis subsp. hyointestinalis]PPB74916.1 transcriptional regulator [Campylobacter hyointestinalis subsp. hyointestinalis]PPB76828.1 transcriptional regulator [Campylobacter hyointestinalis subsp. hyointestinalis]PPB77318.1 transcriptional regulator [Campylobacter hyointestinalis subsp. hyointestinalis]